MSSADQTGLHQRSGYPDQSAGYANERGYSGAPPQAQGKYPPQAYPVQPSYEPYRPELGPNEYVDKHNRVQKRRRGGRLACCLAACWCLTWPCHGPCCGGL